MASLATSVSSTQSVPAASSTAPSASATAAVSHARSRGWGASLMGKRSGQFFRDRIKTTAPTTTTQRRPAPSPLLLQQQRRQHQAPPSASAAAAAKHKRTTAYKPPKHAQAQIQSVRPWMSAAQLADSPSRRDGVTEEVEQKCRLCGCSLMRAMAKGLEFNHETTATAMEFFHRFYARQSYAHHDYSVGAGMCGAWLSMLTTSLLCACLRVRVCGAAIR